VWFDHTEWTFSPFHATWPRRRCSSVLPPLAGGGLRFGSVGPRRTEHERPARWRESPRSQPKCVVHHVVSADRGQRCFARWRFSAKPSASLSHGCTHVRPPIGVTLPQADIGLNGECSERTRLRFRRRRNRNRQPTRRR